MVKLDAIVMVNDLVVVTWSLSVTCTAKENGPLLVGLPLMLPVVGPSVRPVGGEPAETAQV
jgi:hypothetical protein